MAVIIQFETEEDHVRAINLLAEAEESYQGAPKDSIIISNRAARLLKAQNVKFTPIGGDDEEKRYATSP